MSLTRSFFPSQSSKKSSIWRVCGWTPPNSGLVAFCAPLVVGRVQVADLLIESSLGLKRNVSSWPASSFRLALPISCGLQEPVVGQLQGLGRDLVAARVERRPCPLHGTDPGQVPAAHDPAA